MRRNIKYSDIQSLRGVAGTLKTSLSFKEMKQIAEESRLNEKRCQEFVGIKRKEP